MTPKYLKWAAGIAFSPFVEQNILSIWWLPSNGTFSIGQMDEDGPCRKKNGMQTSWLRWLRQHDPPVIESIQMQVWVGKMTYYWLSPSMIPTVHSYGRSILTDDFKNGYNK